MSKNLSVKETFVELLKRNAIEGRITTNPYKLGDSNYTIDLSFNEVDVTDSITTFYDDPCCDRAEDAGIFSFDLDKLERVVYKTDVLNLDELYGKYDAILHFTNMEQILITFNMKDRTEIPEYIETARPKSKSFEERIMENKVKKQEIINAIHSHKGTFLINVNVGDFIKSKGFEAFNLIFSHIKSLRQNELLSFDNSNMQPIRFTNKNVPVYPMNFSTNFYIEIKNIVSVEEINAKEYADVFEYPTTRIFNLHMEDETIITVGLMED